MNKYPKIIILKIKKGLKNGKFSVDFKSLVKYAQKGSNKNVTEICTFLLLLKFIKFLCI